LPWEASLVDIARNHRDGAGISDFIGDMFHFKPGRHAHIARKLELSREPDSDSIRCEPASFRQGEGRFTPASSTLELCWRLTDRIMQALIPRAMTAPTYRIVVQRLMYQLHRADNERLYTLVDNSLGRWARLGYHLDRRREQARGLLAPWGVCDVFALMSMFRPLRKGLDALNRTCGSFGSQSTDDGHADVIGKAHYDSRYFSGLSGARRNVHTEILVGDHWIELPIVPDSMVVIPGLLAQKHFGIAPVLHRVLHGEETGKDETDTNISLLFGAK
jgi:hypothetical protein